MIRSGLRFLSAAFVTTMLVSGAWAQDQPIMLPTPFDFANTNPPATWEFNAAILFLQPNAGNLEYATLVSPLPAPTPNWYNQSIDPHYTPAFRFGARRVLDDANDFQVSWTHLDTNDSASVVGRPDQFVGPPYLVGPGANAYTVGHGNVHFGWDAVNLDFGHLWGIGQYAQVRVFGGVQFARIREELTGSFSNYSGTTTTTNVTSGLFTGAGPRLGARGQYNRGHLQLFGELGAAAIIGTNQSHINFYSTSPSLANLNITPPNTQSMNSPTATQVIPALDTRLGAAYALPLTNYGLIKFEAGYQAVVYVNAINSYSMTEVTTPPVVQSVGVFLATVQHQQNNFMAQGPYLSASWVF